MLPLLWRITMVILRQKKDTNMDRGWSIKVITGQGGFESKALLWRRKWLKQIISVDKSNCCVSSLDSCEVDLESVRSDGQTLHQWLKITPVPKNSKIRKLARAACIRWNWSYPFIVFLNSSCIHVHPIPFIIILAPCFQEVKPPQLYTTPYNPNDWVP